MKKGIYILMCMCILLAGCSSEQSGKKAAKKKAVTAKVQSAPYELLVVADKEWLKTGTGKVLMEVLESPIEVLPQVEPAFRITSINPDAFNGVFRTYANIVCVDVGEKYKEPEVRLAVNVYARPQRILYVTAPDHRSFEQLVAERGKTLLDELNENEFARERALLKKQKSGVVSRQANKQFGVDINAPQDIDDIKVGKNFFWASASKQEFRLNICMYTLPLQDMTADQMLAARDSVMKINIPGGKEGQWMETDPRAVLAEKVQVGGRQIAAFRGLWGMRKDAMGGPFVAYYYPDSVNNRLLVAEGFIFAPEEKKRPLIRKIEASLQTVAGL